MNVRDTTEEKKTAVEVKQKMLLVSLLHKITQKANLSVSVRVAMEFAAENICRAFDWALAHVYCVGRERPILDLPTSIWYGAETERFEEFKKATLDLYLAEWRGLPGRVFVSKNRSGFQR